MADVRAFRALRYADGVDLEAVLAPPYDVIPDEDVSGWHSRHEANVSRVTKPGSDYQAAAQTLGAWIETGVLVEDTSSMYVYEVDFEGRVRRDLIAALRLQPYEDRAVLPHELTHRGPKEDRLALMRATGASLEPLWFLYDPEGNDLPGLLDAATRGSEPVRLEFQGLKQRLWRVKDPEWQTQVHASFADRPVLIADGHHRYETTLAYSQEVGGGPDAAARFTPALLSSIADPGLEVLPTHRVMVTGVKVTGGEPAGSLDEVLTAIEGKVAAGVYDGRSFQVLPLEGDLALVELHRQVIDNILGKKPAEGNVLYTRDAREAVEWVDAGRGVSAFFLPRPDLGRVLEVARAGKTLPQKSTYFYPKPPSGLVLHRLDPQRPL